MRQRILRGIRQQSIAKLPDCTRQHGIPVELTAVAEWRSGLPEDGWEPLPYNEQFYTDGSCVRPRHHDVRVAA